MTTDSDANSGVNWKPLVWLFLGVLGLWGLSWFVVTTAISDWPERGTFGDMFGGVNALFSGLAFAGVIYAIFLQRKELSLQRKELKLTRNELKKTAKAQEKQSAASRGLLELEERRRKLDDYNRVRELDIDLQIMTISQNTEAGLRMVLDNQGAPVFDVEISTSDAVALTELQRSKRWYPGTGKVAFELANDETKKGPLIHFGIVVRYTNKVDMRRSRAYNVYINRKGDRHWIREIETVNGDHPNLILEIGEHIEEFERPSDA